MFTLIIIAAAVLSLGAGIHIGINIGMAYVMSRSVMISGEVDREV